MKGYDVMSKLQTKEDTSYITLLSVISAIAVVFLHVNKCFWTFSLDDDYWFSANIIECLFYFAVPIFFMISGATLIDYRDRYSTKEYFIKRIKKTVIPFLIWTVISIGYFLWDKRINFSHISLHYIVGRFLNPKPWIYWFFPKLFVVYSIIPLLSFVPKEKRKNVFLYLAVLIFISNSLIPFIQNNVYHFEFELPFMVGGEYTFYILAGYWLRYFKLDRKKEIAVYVAAILGLLIHIIGTYRLSMNAGSLIDTYKGYTNLPCVLYSLGVFLFFRNYGNKIMSRFLNKPVKFLSRYTFGIYLLHMYIVETFPKLINAVTGTYLYLRDTSLIYRLTAPFIIIPICILIIFLLRKIPAIRHIVP